MLRAPCVEQNYINTVVSKIRLAKNLKANTTLYSLKIPGTRNNLDLVMQRIYKESWNVNGTDLIQANEYY